MHENFAAHQFDKLALNGRAVIMLTPLPEETAPRMIRALAPKPGRPGASVGI